MRAFLEKPKTPKVEEPEWKYPCLGRCGERVILFTSDGCGVVIANNCNSSDDDHEEDSSLIPMGQSGTGWNMDYYTPLKPNERMILAN